MAFEVAERVTFAELFVKVRPPNGSQVSYVVSTSIVKYKKEGGVSYDFVGVFEQDCYLRGTVDELVSAVQFVVDTFFPEDVYGPVELCFGLEQPDSIEDGSVPLHAESVWEFLVCCPE